MWGRARCRLALMVIGCPLERLSAVSAVSALDSYARKATRTRQTRGSAVPAGHRLAAARLRLTECHRFTEWELRSWHRARPPPRLSRPHRHFLRRSLLSRIPRPFSKTLSRQRGRFRRPAGGSPGCPFQGAVRACGSWPAVAGPGPDQAGQPGPDQAGQHVEPVGGRPGAAAGAGLGGPVGHREARAPLRWGDDRAAARPAGPGSGDRARRKRLMWIAIAAAVLVVAGGGTAAGLTLMHHATPEAAATTPPPATSAAASTPASSPSASAATTQASPTGPAGVGRARQLDVPQADRPVGVLERQCGDQRRVMRVRRDMLCRRQ